MRRLAGLLLIAIAATGLGCGEDGSPPPAGELQAIADGLTDDVLVGDGLAGGKQRFHVPGTSLTVASADGAPETVVSGVSSIADDAPLEAGQVQVVGSNTKVVTAVLVLRLVEEGRLGLDERLPEIAEGNDADGGRLSRLAADYGHRVDEVTLRELLNHTSGLVSWDNSKVWAQAFARDPLQHWRLEQLSRYGLAQPPLLSPVRRISGATATPTTRCWGWCWRRSRASLRRARWRPSSTSWAWTTPSTRPRRRR